jgi:thioester reductase-like protein
MMSRLSDTFAVELPLRLLFESPTVAGMAQAIDQIRHTGNVATKIVIDFNAEAVLDSTIQLPSGAVEAIAKPHSIFLTGATGFLGAYLLYELLEQTTVDVYCLVRAENADEGKKRLQSKLESYSIWNETFNSRIIPVVGELSQPLLGLSESLFDHLASQIDVIYHNGAMVNFIYPYFELKAANVLGTQEVLKLATQIKAKPVHLISTVSVFSIDSSNYSEVRVVRESDIDDIQKLDGGYSQSKWVAEKLMMQARDRGLPVCIYRPSRITWHSQTGFAHLDDLLNRFIKGCIQLGKVPDGNFEDNMIPVDYVSRAIIHLSQQTESLGKTFHLTNPHLTSWDELFSWFRSKGYPLEQISYIQWRNELRHQKENALSPFLSMFYQDSFSDDLPTKIIWPQFDRQNTQKGLAGTDIVCPPIDTKLLDTYLSYLKKSGFLEAPPLHRS